MLPIRAIVATGQLSNADDARLLGDVIIRRRDKVVSYWLTCTNPLDRFRVSSHVDGSRLDFDNAAIRFQLTHEPAAAYDVAWSALDNMTGATREVLNHQTLTWPSLAIPMEALGPADASGSRYAVAIIRTHHTAFPEWQAPVVVTVLQRQGTIDVVGIERASGTLPVRK